MKEKDKTRVNAERKIYPFISAILRHYGDEDKNTNAFGRWFISSA